MRHNQELGSRRSVVGALPRAQHSKAHSTDDGLLRGVEQVELLFLSFLYRRA